VYKHRPDIDGLRALAVMPVILFHAHLKFSGGFVGVDIFFVISGFLITTIILKEITEKKFSLVAFWERRIRRILPALVVVVLATLVAGWFLYLPDDLMSLGASVMAQSALISNVFFYWHSGYFEAGADTLPLLHTWSLAVEEQFYLLLPLLLMFLAGIKRSAIPSIIAALGLCSFALSIPGTYHEPSATFYLLPTRAWELMLGAYLAAKPGMQLSREWTREMAAVCGLGFILGSIFLYTNRTRFPGLAALPPCLGAALIILSGNDKPTLVGKILSLRPVVFIGLISYSLYLWHWPLLVFAKYGSVEPENRLLCLGAVMASFVPAILSWKFVETPFRKRRVCATRPQVFAFAGCSALVLLAIGTSVKLGRGMPSRVPAKALVYAGYRHDFALRNEITAKKAEAGEFAELGGQDTNQPVELMLWGDSHAQALAPVIDDLCRRFSVRGVEATHAATAPLVGYVSSAPGSLGENSPAFSKAVLAFISQRHLKAVIVAAYWASYGPTDLRNEQLSATVQAVNAAGARVYVVKDVPILRFDAPRLAALTVMHNGDVTKLGSSPEDYRIANSLHGPDFTHISRMGAIVLDTPSALLNGNGRYDVVRNDKVLYYDWQHLSVEGAKVLEPLFEPLFRQIKH
jgi:peptidoglycan/LPS O-acetylase OafA/YrhL